MRRWLVQLAGALLLVAGVVGYSGSTEARVDPFYIVHGQSYGAVVPRILFVLDTSGSMGFEQPWPDKKCSWDNCEDGDAGLLQSRMHAARNVIRSIVEANEGTAEFGLMSFGMAKPPASASEVPYECYSWDHGKWMRFTWVSYANQPYGNVWKPLTNAFGTQGSWTLCGDNRPFPYLRHDDLGGFSMPNNSTEALSDTEPLVKTHADINAFYDGANFTRRVQFFPRYLGRRFNLDCGDPNKKAIVNGSHGDWGESDSARESNICGRDFYYWPYVDGNPGYSFYSGYSFDDMWHVECDDNGECWSTNSASHRLGTNRRNQYEGATLYAPFYSEAVLNDPDIPASAKGPLSVGEGLTTIEGLTSKAFAGGIDLSGGTPWAVAIGDVGYMVKENAQGELEAKAALTQSNAAFSHTTVASYLSFMTVHNEDDVCRPTAAILVTDGQPDPWWKQGGTKLYDRLRKLRQVLGVKTYMVGFSQGSWSDPLKWERMHHIACAASGANDVYYPCNGSNDYDWDTCANPDDPQDGCAWLAANDEELAKALRTIIEETIESEMPSGAPTLANDFQSSDVEDPNADDTSVQTAIRAYTEAPSWRGHVAREACLDEDPDNPGELADYCKNAATLPIETEEDESFGPCPIGRVWDAGECLVATNWKDRRLYTHNDDNELVRILDEGEATSGFAEIVMEMNQKGLIDPPLTPGNEGNEIRAMAQYLAGAAGNEGWKLAGIANSAPILIRRVPQYDSNFLPGVGIRDPHCAGRRNVLGEDVPSSLQAYAGKAWSLSSGAGYGDHYEYAEAVLIGDDAGLLHAFHYDSGNELFAFLPRALINNSRVLSINGATNFGQGEGLEGHVYGIASTVNAGWIYDDEEQTWRHLAVFGFGPGGDEIVALDVSHMARLADDDPVEVLWTSDTASISGLYDQTLGETWSRPAITYAVPNDTMGVEPKAYLVFGSGYREGAGWGKRGRVVWMVDAATGETVTQRAIIKNVNQDTTYDVKADVTQAGDVAVTSHCLSRYWGEMQEAYWVDPAGRLFRWDLATAGSDVESFPHVADSGGTWTKNSQGYYVGKEAFRFPACEGAGEFSCTVGAISASGNKGEPFTFSPAVVANNRIDPINGNGGALDAGQRDMFLLALVSGNANDDAIDGGDEDNAFHSSIYLIADDHRDDPNKGFDIPGNAAVTEPGGHAHFMRLPLSQIERTRHIQYPDGSEESQTRVFSKRARPLRAPMIRVTGVSDGVQQVNAEVFYITYTVYEPGDSSCDSRWFDPETKEWIFDQGATYELTFRLAVEGGQAFDFQTDYTLPNDPNDGFGTGGALSQVSVSQVGHGCEDGNCGAILRAPSTSPCDPNVAAPPVGGVTSVVTGSSELDGFSPLEIPL
ncbi:type IV pilin biogenesis protein, putative [Plesiocystis pacifica SIR-1]|uniref:Type IV pilin biogenesis protein, putative n=1 Tax=Plesiocystis pacifica SIR-1 TaxID=391625 RepID=A6FY97_9BACT|nr:hypothetical protein [Plesiocystis pacifica]EDM81476.1 type IV pilin biogenesis protein, putative [Plesiocystis pacifica SIR-1]